jgi:hypothetical protein
LTKVDQKGSLGFVGDGFEVMARVGRRLTKVNTVDPLLRVNLPAKNLGRHTNPLFVRFVDSSHILCVGLRE